MADPHDPLHHLQREVERMFLDLVYQRHPSCHFTEPTWSPAADVMVSEDSARVIMELAGVPRENVRVRLQGRILEVSGRRHSPKDPALSHYHRAEILFGDFRRVIELPWEADEKRVDARYQDGMLEIHLFPSPTHRTTRVTIEKVESK
ncbi:MAG: Hsp20/alpha crystallin family protein [Candidatus Eisenbacteria bacterium]|uniref:Hsp20/alpha crystallin family protein n=1 Tax=Eiseniibacteriota bacterium TaxID=2212470 RepID=A0A538S7S8_UNCEI|nr:MAG: Hsp20/alpha crystallin family protein [Candidatus Eisenbacteria bacterium]